VIYLLSTKNQRLDAIPIGIETILLSTFMVLFFIESMSLDVKASIFQHYAFWLCVGILIYLGGSFFFFILINNLTKEQVDFFGKFTYLTEVIKNICFVCAILVSVKFQRLDINNYKARVV
jgi:hypothetical protein